LTSIPPVSTAGKYWVEVSNGICTSSDTIHVSVASQTNNLGDDTTLCSNQIVLPDAGIADSYMWSTGATTQTINVATSGTYWVKTSNGNCFTSDTINISFFNLPACDCLLYMPGAFTPNNDGLNDIFKPAKRGGCEFQRFSVYNRWGKKVFETSDLSKGWDGRCTRTIQETGVFIWQVHALKDGVKKIFKGTVILMR
jgi:gliding motility-associated-like protein